MLSARNSTYLRTSFSNFDDSFDIQLNKVNVTYVISEVLNNQISSILVEIAN